MTIKKTYYAPCCHSNLSTTYSKYRKLHHSLECNCENHEIQGCLLMPLMDVIFTEHILTDLSMDL